MADEHLQHLMQLIETKQVYTSYALLRKIPADTYIPGKQKIHDELRAALIKGKAIHAILQNSRNNGDYPTALKQGLKLQKIVPDYPNLKHDIAAIRTVLKKLEAALSEAKIAASHGRKEEVIKLLQTIRQIDAGHSDIPLIEKTVRRKAQSKSVTSIIVSILIIVLPCALFGAEKIMLWQAQDNLNSASQQIKISKFKEANKSIAKMHSNLRFIQVFNRLDRESLEQQAASLQSSMVFVQGMRGRVIHDGEFISERKKKIITNLETLMLKASGLADQEEWQDALATYNETLAFIQQHEAQIGSEQPVILEKIVELERRKEEVGKQRQRAECLTIISLANKAYGKQKWQVAIDKYKEAFDFARDTDISASCVSEQSRSQYSRSMVTILLHKGDTLQKEKKPTEAVDHYLQAIELATANSIDETTIQNIQSRIDGLKEQVFMGQVRLLIREGDKLIDNGDFNGGLSKYNFGLTMLASKSEFIQGKAKLTSQLSQKIQQTEQTATLANHKAHLKTTAETDLRKYFGLPPQDKLEKLAIVLTGHQDNIFTYCISAMSIREKVKYELFYQIDENTGKWTLVK